MRTRLPTGQDRRFRGFDSNSFDFRIVLTQPFTGASKRRRRADALNKSVDASTSLLPDFFRQLVVTGDLVCILHLIGPEGARFSGDNARGSDHVAGQLLSHPATDRKS